MNACRLVSALIALSAACSAVADEVVEIFEDKGDLFIRAGKNKGVAVGSEVTLLGEKIANTEERRSVGAAAVMEAWDTIARIKPMADVKKESIKAVRVASRAASKAARKAEATAEPAAAPAPSGPSKTSSSGFSDRMQATCEGAAIEVVAGSTLTGGWIRLHIDGKVADAGDIAVGQAITLKGSVKGKPALLRAEQGMFRTSYSLTVGGKVCPLQGG